MENRKTLTVTLVEFKPSTGGTLRSPRGTYYTRASLESAIHEFRLSRDAEMEIANELLSDLVNFDTPTTPQYPANIVTSSLRLDGNNLVCNIKVADVDEIAYAQCKWSISLCARSEIIERPGRFESVNEVIAIKRITAAF